MGVNVFLLDRRPTRLNVAGTEQEVGSLRRAWKLTELDEQRARDMVTTTAGLRPGTSPKVAMLAEVTEMPIGSERGIKVRAHLVIGWDEGRTSVTDLGWDYLPVLGYAVRDPDSGVFILYEQRYGALKRLGRDRALELALIGQDGELLAHGQPVIAECRSVRPYIDGYAEADCTLADGRTEKILIALAADRLPEPEWFVHKRPVEVEFCPSRSAPGRTVPLDGAGRRR